MSREYRNDIESPMKNLTDFEPPTNEWKWKKMKKNERKCIENERKWKKMKENYRKLKKLKKIEKWKTIKNERKWKKIWKKMNENEQTFERIWKNNERKWEKK